MTRGEILNYLGMTLDFRTPKQVKITMAHCVDGILSECGVIKGAVTPATSRLFDVRDDQTPATEDERVWFHSFVARMLHLSKRVRPECLTAVSFLSTRVHVTDTDDLTKLRRLVGYLRSTRDRGIILRVGDRIEVRAYIDASYGVHYDGKSHTGCAVVI